MRATIYLSHAPDGAEDARSLGELITDREGTVWVTRTSDLSSIDVFVAVITPDYPTNEKSWSEFEQAEVAAGQHNGVAIVLLAAGGQIPERLQHYLRVSLTRPMGAQLVTDILNTAEARHTIGPVRRPSPFVGRTAELRRLVSWCGFPERHSGAVVLGAPGTGRTRLARELCAQMRADGWNAGFSGDPGLLPSSAARTLVVIDHAEIAPIARIIEALEASAHDRTRVLLLGGDVRPGTLWDQVVQIGPDRYANQPSEFISLNKNHFSPRELRDLVGSHDDLLQAGPRAETALDHLLAASAHRSEMRNVGSSTDTWADFYFRWVLMYWSNRLTAASGLPEKQARRITWIAAVAGLPPDALGDLAADVLTEPVRLEFPSGWSVLPAPDGTTLLEHELLIGHPANESPEWLHQTFQWALTAPERLDPFLVRMASAAACWPRLRERLADMLGLVFGNQLLAAQRHRDALSMCISAVEPVIARELAERWRDRIGESEKASTLDFLGTGDQRARADSLDRGAWIDALVTMLRPMSVTPLDRDATGPSVIAVDGPWGAGKTSLMGIVRSNLDKMPAPPGPARWQDKIAGRLPKRWLTLAGAIYLLWRKPGKRDDGDFPAPVTPVTVWFNPWAHQSSDQVWAGMARAILEAVSKSLFSSDHERAKYWLRRNGSRLDRGVLRRSLLRNSVSPLMKLAVFTALVPIGVALLRYQLPIELLGVRVETGATAAKWLAVVLGATALLDTARRFLFGQAANYCPAGLLDGPVLSGAMAQPGADTVLRDPLYHARSGYLYLLQHDIRELLQDAADARLCVVVFVDDLDRCNPKTACEVLEAVNLFLSEALPATKFVIGLDMGVVAAQIDEVMKDFKLEKNRRYFDDPSPGWTFLRKLVQLPVLLPRIERSTMERMVTRFLGKVTDVVETPQSTHTAPAEAAARMVADTTVTATAEVVPRTEPASPQQENPVEAPIDLAKLERHPAVRERIQQRLDALPVQSAREAKRLLTVWQFYLRVLSGNGTPVAGADQVLQAKAVVLLAEIVVRWPALSAHLFGVVDGEQGVTRLRIAAPGDDVGWAQAVAKVGLDPTRDKNAAKEVRELLRGDDAHLLAALARRLL